MIYDITQPLFDCVVYPGNSAPQMIPMKRIADGERYNLTDISLCVHNGTHVDSPFHFYKDGKTIEQISLEKFIGKAYVVSHKGDVTAEDAKSILEKAESEGAEKILLKGELTITLEAAQVFARAKIDLLGNESQSTGPKGAGMPVHLALLGAEVVLLEGIRLGAVNDGFYFLNCAPINLAGCDGAPCRATLMDI
jgi:arylformamidase